MKAVTTQFGLFLDTSPSMRLRDPIDGNGHLTRWDLAINSDHERQSPLEAIDEARTRTELSRMLAGEISKESRDLIEGSLVESLELIKDHQPVLPYPVLVEEICRKLREAKANLATFRIAERGI